MRFKTLVENVGPNAFVEQSFVLSAKRVICFIDDFEELEHYHPVAQKDIELTEKKSSKPWVSLEAKVKATISLKRKAALEVILRENDEEWNSLVFAAQEHQSARYRNDSVPYEIELYSSEYDTTPKKATQAILKEHDAIESKVEELKTKCLLAQRALKESNSDAELLVVYTDFLKYIDSI